MQPGARTSALENPASARGRDNLHFLQCPKSGPVVLEIVAIGAVAQGIEACPAGEGQQGVKNDFFTMVASVRRIRGKRWQVENGFRQPGDQVLDTGQTSQLTGVRLVIHWNHRGQCCHSQDLVRSQDVGCGDKQHRAVHTARAGYGYFPQRFNDFGQGGKEFVWLSQVASTHLTAFWPDR
ncbi:MAG: hypothetical protein LRY35_01595 [Clostridiales bacterium]|nr:hypothetical protein [Clostridiales bacterium]